MQKFFLFSKVCYSAPHLRPGTGLLQSRAGHPPNSHTALGLQSQVSWPAVPATQPQSRRSLLQPRYLLPVIPAVPAATTVLGHYCATPSKRDGKIQWSPLQNTRSCPQVTSFGLPTPGPFPHPNTHSFWADFNIYFILYSSRNCQGAVKWPKK